MYLSPEMILKTGHNFMVDVYTLGVFTYELLSGDPPFLGEPSQIRKEILQSQVKFP